MLEYLPSGLSTVIHSRATVALAACKLSRGNVTTSWPGVVDAPTLTSQLASAWPLGKVVLTVAVRGAPFWVGSSRSCQVPVVGTGGGPSANQMLCQCEANTRP